MSERTRAVLGNTGNLVEALESGPFVSPEAGRAQVLQFSRLLGAGDRMLISAQPVEPEVSTERREAVELLSIQGSFLRHYFRLQLVERGLSQRTRSMRRATGGSALRQVERERQRIGRDLHTGVGQLLAAIRVQLEIIEAQLPAPPEPVRQALARIGALAAEALDQVRSVAQKLHPPEWQRLTLGAALQRLWEMSGIPQRFEASVHLPELPQQPDFDQQVLLYRAAQEALSNVTRHARATRVEMSLEARESRLVLTIRDNGVGFDVAGARAATGLGLRSLREQAEALGAEIRLTSGSDGTTLEISTPYPSRQS
jgi:signal transduction histidine kinase